MNIERLETPSGLIIRASPTKEEFERARRRAAFAAAGCLLVGAGVSGLEEAMLPQLQAGGQLLLFVAIPFLVGLTWAARFLRAFFKAKPTAVVATDHSLRLEQIDGSSHQEIDLASVSSIRIGPDGFSPLWRWMKGPRAGMVVLRLRGTGSGLGLPPQLASHPVIRQLLARMLAASRSRGPVVLAGPSATVDELEQLARSAAVVAPSYIPPITIPAGWYPDPAGQAPLRWWDGRAWADYTRESPPS